MAKKVTITISDEDSAALQRYTKRRQDSLGEWQESWVGSEAAELSTDNDPTVAESVAFVVAENIRRQG